VELNISIIIFTIEICNDLIFGFFKQLIKFPSDTKKTPAATAWHEGAKNKITPDNATTVFSDPG